MTAYVIAQIEVHDPEGYKAYLAGFMPIFERHGGRLLATSARETAVIEGEWGYPRTVLMEFADLETATRWLNDPDYAALAEIRKRTARTNMALVEGVGQHG